MKFFPCCMAILLSICLLSCAGITNQQNQLNGKYIVENVAYSSIIALQYNPADETLAYGNNELQFGKLWLPTRTPADSRSKVPLIIFVHGGCWLNAYSIEHSFPLTSALAEHGFMVFSLEYRRTGDAGGGWPGSIDDVLQGIQYFLQQSQYIYDYSNVYLVGHSAGGHLALLAQHELAKRQPGNAIIPKVVGLAAISDLTKYAKGKNSCQLAVRQFMAGSFAEIPQIYRQADPAQQLTGDTFGAQRFVLHGTADEIVPLSQSTQVKFAAQVVPVQGGGHFDWLHPQTESFQVLVNLINHGGN